MSSLEDEGIIDEVLSLYPENKQLTVEVVGIHS